MSLVSLRSASSADVSAIASILNHAIANTTAVWYQQAKTEAEIAAWLDEKYRNELPVLVATAVDGDSAMSPGVDDIGSSEVIAYATYGPFRPWPGYRKTVEHSIYVAPQARRQGIGQKLQALIEHASQAGYHAMIGGIEAENHGSLALHRRLGFDEVGRLPEVGRKFDRWLTLVFVQKMLD
jgi:L-amino acid N-acyltransferase YncA